MLASAAFGALQWVPRIVAKLNRCMGQVQLEEPIVRLTTNPPTLLHLFLLGFGLIVPSHPSLGPTPLERE